MAKSDRNCRFCAYHVLGLLPTSAIMARTTENPMNTTTVEQHAASRSLPALVIDLNALAASGAPHPQMLEQAQEAVRQALQHVLGDTDSHDFDADSTEDDGLTEPAVPEQPSFCAIGWAYASGEGRVQAAAQQALAHPLLHAAMQNPTALSKLGVALSTTNEPLPLGRGALGHALHSGSLLQRYRDSNGLPPQCHRCAGRTRPSQYLARVVGLNTSPIGWWAPHNHPQAVNTSLCPLPPNAKPRCNSSSRPRVRFAPATTWITPASTPWSLWPG